MSAPSLSEFSKKFRTLIDQGRTFLILTHVRPDGDAYGSMLALFHSLKALGKEVTLWNEDGIAERYQFLPGIESVLSGTPPHHHFDLRIVVDNAAPSRVGKIPLPSDPTSPIINIDHHASNSKYGDHSFVDSSRGSCGEIIFDLLKNAQMPISKEAAQCLFVAISTDTGSFQYPATTAATFRIAAELLDLGVDLGETSRLTFECYPPRRLLLLREVLQSAQFLSNNQIGYFWIDDESFKRSGAKPEDTEGLIDHIRSLQPVRVAILFEEIKNEGTVRLSFRSKDPQINVNLIANQFGGGGHPAASGARAQGDRKDIETRVLKAVQDVVNHQS